MTDKGTKSHSVLSDRHLMIKRQHSKRTLYSSL